MRTRKLKRRWHRKVVSLTLGLMFFLVPAVVELAGKIKFVPGRDANENCLTLSAERLAMDTLSIAEGGKVLLENDEILYPRDLKGLDNAHGEKKIRNIIGSEEAGNFRLLYDINHNLELEGQIFSLQGGEGNVIPTPIPASVLLLGSGLLSLGLWGRRRNRG